LPALTVLTATIDRLGHVSATAGAANMTAPTTAPHHVRSDVMELSLEVFSKF
jgi:hypothetical protein